MSILGTVDRSSSFEITTHDERPRAGRRKTSRKARSIYWSGRADLNRGPPAPKAGALPGCATPRHNCSTDSKPLPELAKTRALAKAFVLLCFCSKLCQNCAKTHQFTLAVS